MIKSMTGFGRGRYTDSVRTVTVEIRAVNHRYCELFVKLPRKYAFAEEKIKSEIKKRLFRGKIEVNVTVDNFGVSDTDIRLDKPLAEKYYKALEEMEESFDFKAFDGVSLSLLAKMPEVIKATSAPEDEESIQAALLEATKLAVEDICHMREIEGAKLIEDLSHRTDLIEGIVESITERAPMLEKEYADKLRARIKELLDGCAEVPEERILVEAAFFADKANITEELVRLGSHISQMRAFLNTEEESIGKKMDFLIQEMNREANTIGSKANDNEITEHMLKLKAEIEKIREQVQNIE